MHQHGIPDPVRQPRNGYPVLRDIFLKCRLVLLCLLNGLHAHFSGKAALQHVLIIRTVGKMQMHIRVISEAVLLFQLPHLLLIIQRFPEVVGDVLLQALVRLRRVFRKSNAQPALVQDLTAVFRQMLTVSEGQTTDRPQITGFSLPLSPDKK